MSTDSKAEDSMPPDPVWVPSPWWRRPGGIAGLCVGVGVWVWLGWVAFREEHREFAALSVLSYEALKREEGGPAGYDLELPSGDAQEVKQFLDKEATALGFQPVMLQLPESWHVAGASTLDYGFTQVALVEYVSGQGMRLFCFSFPSLYGSLPEGTALPHKGGRALQGYTSQDFNLLAWQPAVGLTALVISRLALHSMTETIDSGL